MRLKDLVRRGKQPSPEAAASSDPNLSASSLVSVNDVPKETSQDVEGADDETPRNWEDLWSEAYESVKQDPDSSELYAKFELHLAAGGATPENGTSALLISPSPMHDPGTNIKSTASSTNPEATERLDLIQQLALQKLETLPESHIS